MIQEKTLWVIMSKDNKFIAKGTPRNRELVRVDDDKDKKRLLTYSSKGKAEAGFKHSGFYGMWNLEGYENKGYDTDLSKYLKAVEVNVTYDFYI